MIDKLLLGFLAFMLLMLNVVYALAAIGVIPS